MAVANDPNALPEATLGRGSMRSALAAENLSSAPPPSPQVTAAPPTPVAAAPQIGAGMAHDAGTLVVGAASAVGEVFGAIFGGDKPKAKQTQVARTGPMSAPSPFNV